MTNTAAVIHPSEQYFSPSENIDQPIILDFSGMVVHGPAAFTVAGSGHLWRNLRVRNLTVYDGDVTIDGGAHDSEAGYEAFYSFRFDNLCITDGSLVVAGNAFEGRFDGGRIERGNIVVEDGPASFLYFDAMTVSAGSVVSHIGDSHFHRMTVLLSPAAGIVQTNNISGVVSDCHIEQCNQQQSLRNAGVEVANVARVRNVYVIPGPCTDVGVDVYAAGNRGAVSGFVHDRPLANVRGSFWDRRKVRVRQ